MIGASGINTNVFVVPWNTNVSGSTVKTIATIRTCANDRRRIRGIVQHIKGRDQIEPTLREIDSIDCLEGHSIGQPLCLGVRTGALDRRKMRIEAPEARLWQSLRHFQRCQPLTAADIRGRTTRSQPLLHLRNGRNPRLHELVICEASD